MNRTRYIDRTERRRRLQNRRLAEQAEQTEQPHFYLATKKVLKGRSSMGWVLQGKRVVGPRPLIYSAGLGSLGK